MMSMTCWGSVGVVSSHTVEPAAFNSVCERLTRGQPVAFRPSTCAFFGYNPGSAIATKTSLY